MKAYCQTLREEKMGMTVPHWSQGLSSVGNKVVVELDVMMAVEHWKCCPLNRIISVSQVSYVLTLHPMNFFDAYLPVHHHLPGVH